MWPFCIVISSQTTLIIVNAKVHACLNILAIVCICYNALFVSKSLFPIRTKGH